MEVWLAERTRLPSKQQVTLTPCRLAETYKSSDKSGKPVDVTDSELQFRVGTGANLQKVKPVHVGTGKYNVNFVVPLPGNFPIDLWYEDKSVLTKAVDIRFYSGLWI